LRGLKDKYIERLMAARWLPREVAWRRKAMFRTPLDSFHLTGPDAPKWIQQVLSPESLKKTDFFDVEQVLYWRQRLPEMRRNLKRTSVELGLSAVTATQLWHHLYISGDLAEMPSKVNRELVQTNRGAALTTGSNGKHPAEERLTNPVTRHG
jgi:asparagine synthase (glutamine-hydrolysing)